jgi:hypothetical protein
MAWGAVLALARVELRRSWRTLVVLGLLAGLAGGVVIAAVALGERTATAPARLRAAVHVDDARVLWYGDRATSARVAELPMVKRAWIADFVVAQVKGGSVTYAGIMTGPPQPPDLFTPVVVEGRAPVGPNEVMLAEEVAQSSGNRVGSALHLALLTPEQVAQFDTGFGTPAGPKLTVLVTGIARVPSATQGIGGIFAAPSFDAAYGIYSAGQTVLLRLKPEPGSALALKEAVDELAKTVALPDDAAELGPLQALFPQRTEDPKVRTALHVLVAGLGVFVLVAVLAGLLATGQSFARHHAAGAAEQRIEAALGLTTGERVLARTLPAVTGALVAGVVAAIAALAAAGLEPMGSLRVFEPSPGWRPDVPLIASGAAVVAAVFLAVAAGTTWRSRPRESARTPLPSLLPALVAARLRRPWLLAGTTFAVSRGRGRAAVPVRATVIGAVLGIAGVVAAATFSSGLHRLGTTPSRYGWYAGFSVVDAKPIDVPDVAGDPRVSDLDWVSASSVRLAGEFVPAYSHAPIKGDLPWTVLSGRMPSADDEIAVGPAVASSMRIRLGDVVTIPDAQRVDHRLRVVGTVLTPVDNNAQPLGASVLLTVGGLLEVRQSPPVTSLLVRTSPENDTSLRDILATRFEIISAAPPSEVRNVTGLGRLPEALALFLSLVAVAALAHGLVLTSRRRAHDIAVLRSLGFTPRQVGASLLTMAGVTAAVGLVIGAPLGLAIGRVVWHTVAASTQVATDVALPTVLLALLAPLVLSVAALLAVLPARRSAAMRPSGVLRVE